MVVIMTWDISDNRLVGPFDSAEVAKSWVEDNSDELLFNSIIFELTNCEQLPHN